MDMPAYFIAPNKWVEEPLLILITGLTKDKIRNYRDKRWIEGIHFKLASSCSSEKGKAFKYNRIEIDKFSDNEKVA